MPSGRRPEGEHVLSNAERQARYRARRQAEQPPPLLRYRRPTDRRSRAQRWCDAVAELLALQGEYPAWYEALPDSLHETATAEAAHPGLAASRNGIGGIALIAGADGGRVRVEHGLDTITDAPSLTSGERCP